MSELLNEIREKARSRVGELQKDIQEARDLIALYETELAPLQVIIKVTNPKHTAPSGTSEAVASAVFVAKGGDGRPLVYNTINEPPRHPHTGEVLDTGSSETMLKAVAAQAVKLPAVKLSARWRGHKLPPRCRLFLNKFGDTKGQIVLQQIMNWYRTVNPSIGEASLKQAAFNMAHILVNKNILHKDAPGTWVLI